MTKRDFQALARAIFKSNEMGTLNFGDLVRNMADACAETNPRFDRARFIEACETGTTKRMKK